MYTKHFTPRTFLNTIKILFTPTKQQQVVCVWGGAEVAACSKRAEAGQETGGIVGAHEEFDLQVVRARVRAHGPVS